MIHLPVRSSFLSTARVRARTLGLLVAVAACAARAAEPATRALADLSIEQLMNESVTSVAKREMRLSDSPAAISVLTQEEIRQSGRTTLPELLRLVPGVQVAQNSSHQWAVGVRGFADELTRNVQVLIDGRTAYSTAVGGVDWDVQDVFLDDIERIEVIRGPGATLWGANAVNGVVNVISKSAKDTQGSLATVLYGRDARPEVTVRHGGQLGANTYYRASLKYFDRAAAVNDDGSSARDAWSAGHAGFRIDAEPSAENSFTLQGDYFKGRLHNIEIEPRFTPPFSELRRATADDIGANVLGRWTHRFVNASELRLQFYYDHASEKEADEETAQRIYDFDAQYRFALGARHDLVAGFGYRSLHDTLAETDVLTIEASHGDQDLFNVFLQDTIALVPERLSLTLGSKFEHTPFTGFEYQPSARAVWNVTRQQTAWAALSRAVRTPTRIEHEGRVVTGVEPPGVVQIDIGNHDLESEELLAHEIGYRFAWEKHASLDLTAFYNRYRSLITFEEQPRIVGAGRTIEPSLAENDAEGETYGVEVAARWQAAKNWRLGGGYTWLRSHISGELDPDFPSHQFFVTSHVDFTPQWSWDTSLNYFSHVEGSDTSAYGRWDTGVTWRPRPALELSVFGQNLGARRHRDYDTERLASIPRSFYGKLTWRF